MNHSPSAEPRRFAWVAALKPEKADYYKRLHADPWASVARMIKACNLRNYSIHLREIDGRLCLFSYLEYVGSDFDADMKKMADDPETQRWWDETKPCLQPLPDAEAVGRSWAEMEEIFYLR